MKRFELLEHTADTGLIAYGHDLAEAFANAAHGLFAIMVELDGVHEIESQTVAVSAEDTESLLFNWLNELIYVFEVEKLLLKRFDIIEFGERHLKAECWGEKYDSSRHQIKLGVKSATYHMLKIDKNKVRVIFDV